MRHVAPYSRRSTGSPSGGFGEEGGHGRKGLRPTIRAIFAARLSPRRSFTPAAARRLLASTFVASALFSLPFYLAGAWPIIGFLGLDVALLWLAFRASFRAARAYEDYRLTYLELEFARVSARGARREWRFNPAWVTLERGDAGAAAATAGAAQRRPPARDRDFPRSRRKGGLRRRFDPRAGRSAAGATAFRRIQNAACRLISSSTRLFSSGVRPAVAASRSGSSMPAALAKRFQVAASTRSLGTPRPLA